MRTPGPPRASTPSSRADAHTAHTHTPQQAASPGAEGSPCPLHVFNLLDGRTQSGCQPLPTDLEPSRSPTSHFLRQPGSGGHGAPGLGAGGQGAHILPPPQPAAVGGGGEWGE